ncbi:MAG: accessory gene regulator B family protein [Eubacteriales bacterium]|nr:accessory gene regulator B family protein [Eubacteriales bacterium]
MEKLARTMAEKIAVHMQYDDDKKAVIAYGLTAIFQMTVLLIIIAVIGVVFDFLYESLIIFIGVGIIRKSTGGAHSETMYGCILISALSVAMLASLSRYILCFKMNIILNLSISVFIYLLGLIVFYLKVPIDSPNKPIVKPKKIKRLRKQSYILVIVFFMITVVVIFLAENFSRFYSLAVSLRLTMMWQMFTLTDFGIRFFEKIDLHFKPA